MDLPPTNTLGTVLWPVSSSSASCCSGDLGLHGFLGAHHLGLFGLWVEVEAAAAWFSWSEEKWIVMTWALLQALLGKRNVVVDLGSPTSKRAATSTRGLPFRCAVVTLHGEDNGADRPRMIEAA
jgi:hypothetical protein